MSPKSRDGRRAVLRVSGSLRPSCDGGDRTSLILDDDLPDGSGGDRARELRRDERLGGVSVVVCTAAHPLRQTEIGAWAPVISKPFNLHEVERILRNAAGDRAPMGGQAAG